MKLVVLRGANLNTEVYRGYAPFTKIQTRTGCNAT